MKRVRVGLGVAAAALLMLGSFLVWGEVSAGSAQAEGGGQSGCAAAQRGVQQNKQRLVFEAEAGHLLQQGWQFQSYCCNPEFTDSHGNCSVFLVQG